MEPNIILYLDSDPMPIVQISRAHYFQTGFITIDPPVCSKTFSGKYIELLIIRDGEMIMSADKNIGDTSIMYEFMDDIAFMYSDVLHYNPDNATAYEMRRVAEYQRRLTLHDD
jgi:hypothetical protein